MYEHIALLIIGVISVLCMIAVVRQNTATINENTRIQRTTIELFDSMIAVMNTCIESIATSREVAEEYREQSKVIREFLGRASAAIEDHQGAG